MAVIPNAQTEGQLRNFFQEGRSVGALPVNAYQFSGLNGQHFIIVSAQAPEHGRVAPIYSPDMQLGNGVIREGQTVAPPAAPTATVRFTRGGGVPRQLYSLGMNRVTFYQSAGECKDPSDFDRGWQDYLLVYANGIASAMPLGGQTGFEGDTLIIDSLDYTFDRIYPVGQLQVQRTVTAANRDMIGATYARTNSRALRALGNEVCYVLAKNGADDTPSLHTTLDGGVTWTAVNLIASPIGAWDGELVTDIEATNRYLIITSEDGYYLAPIGRITGTAALTDAVKVENGWAGSYYPSSVFALAVDSVLFTSQDKRIYRAKRLAGGVSLVYNGASATHDLLRVHGYKETAVAVGANQAVVASWDKGQAWTDLTDASDTLAGTLRGVHVLSPYVWWVCGDADNVAFLSYTVNGGQTWVTAALDIPTGITLEAGYDVRFVNDECGYFLALGSDGNTYVFTTMNGGFTWTPSANRVRDTLTDAAATRIAVPEGVSSKIAANSAVIIGDDGSAGYIWTLQAPIR